MTRKRSQIAGMTDYTGVPFDDIFEHLRQWRDTTKEAVVSLQQLRHRVDEEASKLENPDDVWSYVGYFSDLLQRYYEDFERLVTELPMGVRDSHIEIISQIYRSSQSEEDTCVDFRQDHIDRALTDESARPLLDEIYRESRWTIIDYRDLSNLVPRLRTFVGSPSSGKSEELLQLKPTIYGVGIDLKQTARRLREWWKKRRSRRSGAT
jgi:hypothetical protein